MWDHGHWGVGNGMSFPPRSDQGTLAWAPAEEDEMNLLMSMSMFGHQYLALCSWYVCCLPACPVAGVVCAQLISYPCRYVEHTWGWNSWLTWGVLGVPAKQPLSARKCKLPSPQVAAVVLLKIVPVWQRQPGLSHLLQPWEGNVFSQINKQQLDAIASEFNNRLINKSKT